MMNQVRDERQKFIRLIDLCATYSDDEVAEVYVDIENIRRNCVMVNVKNELWMLSTWGVRQMLKCRYHYT